MSKKVESKELEGNKELVGNMEWQSDFLLEPETSVPQTTFWQRGETVLLKSGNYFKRLLNTRFGQRVFVVLDTEPSVMISNYGFMQLRAFVKKYLADTKAQLPIKIKYKGIEGTGLDTKYIFEVEK